MDNAVSQCDPGGRPAYSNQSMAKIPETNGVASSPGTGGFVIAQAAQVSREVLHDWYVSVSNLDNPSGLWRLTSLYRR